MTDAAELAGALVAALGQDVPHVTRHRAVATIPARELDEAGLAAAFAGAARPGDVIATGPARRGKVLVTASRVPPAVIVGCSAGKLDRPAPAHRLYAGPQFRMGLAAALALVPRGRVLVLSARYGLVGLDDTIAPYDLVAGRDGSVPAEAIWWQAKSRQVLDAPVTVLAGKRYAALVRQVWPPGLVSCPLAGLGVGRQRHVLAVMARG